MKVHKPILSQIPIALKSIFEDGYYADKVIERHFKMSRGKWGSRDRKFFAESVYDIVRWYRRINESLPKPHQNDFSAITEAYLGLKEIDYPSIESFVGVNAQFFKEAYDSSNDFGVVASYPDWIIERVYKECGKEKGEHILNAMNTQAPLYLRVNPLKGTCEQVMQSLKSEGIDAQIVQTSDSALIIQNRKNVFLTQAFKSGMFEVQDLGSQAIAPFLQPSPKQRVLDLCAGAGGKTLHLAQLMENKGKIVATDIHERKLTELKRRARRNQVDLIETRLAENKWFKRQKGKMDRILLDVPCSGLGVIKRNPDTKWKLQEDRISELIDIQRGILKQAAPMIKPEGKLVYSTCSILPSENQEQVKWFLETHEGWDLEEEVSLLPHENNTDGFYMARLKLVK